MQDFREGERSLRDVFRREREPETQPPMATNSVEGILARQGLGWRDIDKRDAEARAAGAAEVRARRMIESPILAMLSVELAAKKTDFDLLAFAVAQHEGGDINTQPTGRVKVEGKKLQRKPRYPGERYPVEEFDMTYDVEDLGKKVKRAVPVQYSQDFIHDVVFGQPVRGSAGFVVDFVAGEIDGVGATHYAAKPVSTEQRLSPTKQFLNHFLPEGKSNSFFYMQWTDIKTDPKLEVRGNHQAVQYTYNPSMERFETADQRYAGTEVEFIEPEFYIQMLLATLDRVPTSLEISG